MSTHRDFQGAAEAGGRVSSGLYEYGEFAAQRITVNGDTVVHRIPAGGRKSVPMEIDDAVIIWELTGADDAAPQYTGAVIGQSGGIFLELRPADDPEG